MYREYLSEQAKEEEKIERELDSLINSEVAKQWAKRTEQWKREREARAKLMKDVLDTRKQQIKEKCKPPHVITYLMWMPLRQLTKIVLIKINECPCN